MTLLSFCFTNRRATLRRLSSSFVPRRVSCLHLCVREKSIPYIKGQKYVTPFVEDNPVNPRRSFRQGQSDSRLCKRVRLNKFLVLAAQGQVEGSEIEEVEKVLQAKRFSASHKRLMDC